MDLKYLLYLQEEKGSFAHYFYENDNLFGPFFHNEYLLAL